MATVVTKPTLIVPGVLTKITFTPNYGNFLRVWVIDAPPGSALRKELDNDADSRVRIADLREVGKTFEWTFLPDKGGKYLLAIQEYNRGTDFGGSFADDPDARRNEDAVGAEDRSKAVTVALRLVQRVGAVDDAATLVVYVADDLIQYTNRETHGEKSPALVEATTARARSALVAPDVRTGVAALSGAVAETALGTLSLVLTNLIDRYNDHLVRSGVHYTDDEAHAVNKSYRNPSSPKDLEKSVQELFKRMKFHFENQDVDQIGVGSADYHQDGLGNTQGDFTNGTITNPPTDSASMVAAVADAHRAFEAHRVWSGHASADLLSEAQPLPSLLALHSSFITAVQAMYPPTPAVAHTAATILVHGAGFEERDL